MLFIESTSSPDDPVTTPTGWTLDANGALGVSGRVRGTWFWRIADSTSTDTPTLSGPGRTNQIMAAITVGTFDASSPIGASAQQYEGSIGTTLIYPGLTTPRNDCLIWYWNPNVRDESGGPNAYGQTWNTPNSETFTEQFDWVTSLGVGGGVSGGTFTRPTAGVMGTGSSTGNPNLDKIEFTIAVQPGTGLGFSVYIID